MIRKGGINMRFLLPVVLTFVYCSGCDGDGLSSTLCVEPCYSGPSWSDGVGVCHGGTPSCDPRGVMTCEDEVLPAPETCDGRDEDCNGLIDDVKGLGEICEDIPTCQGRRSCGAGVVVCAVGRPLSDEVCDGIDNDCDGRIDNIPADLCYSGDFRNLRYGRCRVGVSACLSGQKSCPGQVLPIAEICGNDEDDDCDGVVDERDVELPPVDLVIHLDVSASMVEELPIEKQVIHELLGKLRYSNVEVALMRVPGFGLTPDVVLDFSKPADAAFELLSVNVSHIWSDEPIYDSLWKAASQLSWRRDSRKLHVFFGDEEGQSLDGLEQWEVARLLSESGHVFYGFIDLKYRLDYQLMASKTGGQLFSLGEALLELPQILEEDVVGGRCED